MTTALAISYDEARDLAKASGIIPTTYVGKPAQIVAAVSWGTGLGWHPLVSLKRIVVINGTATINAEGMGSLVRAAGHRLDATVTRTEAICKGTRVDTGETFTFEFSVDDAVQADLCRPGDLYSQTKGGYKKGSWAKYTRSMLLARATSAVCRQLFQGELGGIVYVPEEILPVGTDIDEDGMPTEPVEVDLVRTDPPAPEYPEGYRPSPADHDCALCRRIVAARHMKGVSAAALARSCARKFGNPNYWACTDEEKVEILGLMGVEMPIPEHNLPLPDEDEAADDLIDAEILCEHEDDPDNCGACWINDNP